MKTQQTDKQRAGLLRKFHALLRSSGVGIEGKEVILSNYGVTSASQLNTAHLADACKTLEGAFAPTNEADKARKRLIAAIGAWLRVMNQSENINKIKAIACRAAQRDDFNNIPLEQLRSLYAAFTKKQKDLKNVENLTTEELNQLSILN